MLVIFKTLECTWTHPVHLIHMPMDGFKFPSAHPKPELVHKRLFFLMVLNPFANRDRVALNCDSIV